ncbi:MAG: hypothetical protein RLZZ628_1605 [Bacteroidota bacterium]|jgi:hypothetical protein
MNLFKNKTCGGLTLLYTLFVTSCAPVYYQPPTQHTPLFTEKGQMYFSGNFQFGNQVSGLNFHIARAVHPHWAIGLNGNFVGTGNFATTASNYTSSTVGQSNFGAINVGYFGTSVDKKSIFEIFTSLGRGQIANKFNTGMSEVNLTCLSVQPALGWRKKYAHLVLSSRFSFLSYDVKTNTFQNLVWFEQANALSNRIIPLFEPAFMFRVGGEHIKGFVQFITAIQLNSSQKYFIYNPSSISTGICVDIRN